MIGNMTPCRFLTAEVADSGDGGAVLEAAASTRAAQHADVMAEVCALLSWCERRHPHDEGPRDDGHAWHHDLQVTVEEGGWHGVTLAIAGSTTFVEELVAVFFPEPD